MHHQVTVKPQSEKHPQYSYQVMTQNNIVYLVDDDAAVRHALSTLLERSGYDVNAFSSAEAMLESVDNTRRGVLVLDQRMEGMTGLELQTELNKREFSLPIIFITGHGDVRMSVTAMKSGAVDFIEKPFTNEKLLNSIRDALKQNAAHLAELTRKESIKKRLDTLTPREREVIGYIVQGTSNRNLAEKLNVSNRTIEVHRSRIMTKMQADSLPDLVRMAALCGIGSD